MSYGTMLKHRCTLQEMQENFINGVPVSNWANVATNVPCFLDLNFLRRGKDPIWTPEAGRPADRTGVLFVAGNAVVRSGMRIKMTKGPAGSFQIQGAIDEAWRPTKKHHIEVGVIEVPGQISKGQGPK